MKRFVAALVLAFGLLPSLPIGTAEALLVPNQEDLQDYCRARLGFGPTEPLHGALVLQFRRCINLTKAQYEKAMELKRRTQQAGQHYWARGDIGNRVVRRTARSIREQRHAVENVRTTYYKETPIADRDALLQAHRVSRRLIVQERERQLLRERRNKIDKWRQAIGTCRYYPRELRQQCVNTLITQ